MTPTRKLRLDRIASSTKNARISTEVIIGPDIVAEDGYVVAARVLDDKATYAAVEDPSGRMIPLRAGDVLAGTLGSRRALRGYAGEVPASIAPGDVLHVLNLGGVVGECTSAHPDLGPPLRVEVLGAVLAFPELGDRIGRPTHIRDHAIPPREDLSCRARVIYVAGTCMSAGKTAAATELTRGLARAGVRVAAAKLTGVALMRDTLAMTDAGAVLAATFNEAGAVSTGSGTSVPIARGILSHLDHAASPDVIVAELGDGILGEYGVQEILRDPRLMGLAASIVMAAPDPVACWGAVRLMQQEFDLSIDVITGPVTDNEVGRRYVRGSLGIPAHNALKDAAGLLQVAAARIDPRRPAFGAA